MANRTLAVNIREAVAKLRKADLIQDRTQIDQAEQAFELAMLAFEIWFAEVKDDLDSLYEDNAAKHS